MNDKQKLILDVVNTKYIESGGNNGNSFGDFDHILKLAIPERNAFLENMVQMKLIVIREGGNAKLIMLPK